MKKIAILTFHKADNYGALLQAYALKQSIIRLGHLAHIINYHSLKFEEMHHLIKHFKLNLRWLKRFILAPTKWYYQNRFAPFRKQYLQDMSAKFYNTLPKLAAQYDLFITGSDQVLNPRVTWFDDRFFLSFCADTNKNVSYAASFGFELKDFTDKEKDFIQQNLTHIKRLSVRETQGKEIIQALTPEREVQVHLDPTLLLTSKDWEAIAQKPSYTKPYCLLYLMQRDDIFTQYAKKIAQEKNWKLLFISSRLDIKHRVPATHITPTVEEWLGLFLNAQYVFTNSFHGLSFCINFNKPFMAGQLNPTWPATSRLSNLLEITGLQHRAFNPAQPKFYGQENWNAVNKILEQQRQKALTYLQEITR